MQILPWSLGGFSVVDAQVPFLVFSKPMLVDELVLFLRGRLVLAPIICLVVNELPRPGSVVRRKLMRCD
jgi:hypothetical protein